MRSRVGQRKRARFFMTVLTLALLLAGGDARAQTPTPPPESPLPSPEPTSPLPPLPEPSPAPQPTPTPSEDPDPQEGTAGPTGGADDQAVARGDRERLADGRGGSPGAGGGHRRRRPRRNGKEDCLSALPNAGPYGDLGGPRSTDGLIRALQPLVRDGTSLRQAFLELGGPLPVAGPSQWANDWHAIRCEPTPHLHEGLDIFAPHGTPVVAVANGRLSQRTVGEVSGLSVELIDDRGIQYFYAHLSAFADGIRPGIRVSQGRVLGYVGATGNARGGTAHLHFEVQPGGVPVPPKPYVDRWLSIAEQRAHRLADRVRAERPAPAQPTPSGAGVPAPEAPERPLSWARSFDSRPEDGWPVWTRLLAVGAPWVLTLLTLVALRPRRREQPELA